MKKKILVISPIPTHPQNAGNRARVYSLLSNLRDMNHDVHFLHLKRELGDDKLMQEFWGDKFYSVP
ncbi:hypothetical protein L0244_27200, partial [bacterium]|nr:hypothetical protein [bacterium]